jgi:signal transduction histidine kinase/CheY-like chemotaxis protein
VLIGGILVTITLVIFTFHSLAAAYLFILPVIFASVLLDQRAVFWVAAVTGLLTLAISLSFRDVSFPTSEIMLPVIIIGLVALASWLSARNLYIALAWVWAGYERARYNEEVAQERQAELRRVLKALDEATHRVERLNYMLALARDQAEEARRLKQQFAQTISHELRTPLNLVVGFIEVMVQSPEYYGQPLPQPYLRDLSIMYRNACHLQNLVNDVLDLARIEAAQMSLAPEDTDIGSLVRETVNTARSLVEGRGLALVTGIADDLPHLRVDPVRIRQVLFNLMNNAVRFTDRGSITVKAYDEVGQVVVAVADTGIGITPEDLPRLFEQFQQLDGSTRRQRGGAGLGLAISKEFVELHRGKMWVESQPGQGSTFFFSLPAGPANLLAIPDEQTGEKGSALSAKWGEEGILLAVTRSASGVSLLDRYVRGCRTVVFQSLEQARHAAQQLIPQLVVVDLACTKVAAAELEGLAQQWGLPNTPFIACPLPGEEPLRQRLAVDSYLLKPVSRQGLWDVLRQFGEEIDRVLVIDDDRDFVRLITRMLDSPVRRYQVISAYSAQEGLMMLDQHQPDLVLLDLRLPDQDGSQVLEQIRSSPQWRNIPVVVVSAQDEIDHMEKLTGPTIVTRTGGLMPGEVVQLIQQVADISTGARLPAEKEEQYSPVKTNSRARV